MARQTSFYMSRADEALFSAYLAKSGDVVALAYASASPVPTPVAWPTSTEHTLWLWNRDLSPAPQYRDHGDRKSYLPELDESEIVEFSRSRHLRNALLLGRLFFQPSFHDSESSFASAKGLRFVQWADRLLGWVKRTSVTKWKGDYVLPGALEFQKAGGVLAQTGNALQ